MLTTQSDKMLSLEIGNLDNLESGTNKSWYQPQAALKNNSATQHDFQRKSVKIVKSCDVAKKMCFKNQKKGRYFCQYEYVTKLHEKCPPVPIHQDTGANHMHSKLPWKYGGRRYEIKICPTFRPTILTYLSLCDKEI
jgi:hypothetical protein